MNGVSLASANKLLVGDCLSELARLPSESVDCCVTDPPYGYCFMGKDWDKAVPSVAVWRECLRVLKAGAFAFVMSSPRQDVLSQMIVRLGEAGFETGFTSIYWTYASGFPKAINISKVVDKRLGVEREIIAVKQHSTNFEQAKENKIGFLADEANKNNTKCFGYGIEEITIPKSEEAKTLDGSYGGFQPKPAVEVIIVAMKPLSEKTFVDQALKNGHGVTWLDNARIPYQNEKDIGDIDRFEGNQQRMTGKNGHNCYEPIEKNVTVSQVNTAGRFPANLICSDDCLNDGVEHRGYTDNHGATSIMGAPLENYKNTLEGGENFGSFSRYFDLDIWFEKQIKKLPLEVQRTFPFLIEPKASKEERNKGLEHLNNGTFLDDSRHDKNAIDCNNPRNRTGKLRKGNTHPTVKPLQLMSYLITLGSRPNDLVLDPFCGSGTTCLAAKMLGRRFIGIELNSEYAELAERRVNSIKTLFEFEMVGVGLLQEKVTLKGSVEKTERRKHGQKR